MPILGLGALGIGSIFGGLIKAATGLIRGNLERRAFEKELGAQRSMSRDAFQDIRRQNDLEIAQSGFERSGGKLQSVNLINRMERQQEASFRQQQKSGQLQSRNAMLGGIIGGIQKGFQGASFAQGNVVDVPRGTPNIVPKKKPSAVNIL